MSDDYDTQLVFGADVQRNGKIRWSLRLSSYGKDWRRVADGYCQPGELSAMLEAHMAPAFASKSVCGNGELTAATDAVERPSHYVGAFTGKECKDFMQDIAGAEGMVLFWKLSAIKYLYRTGKKDDALQDLRKAHRCVGYAIEAMEASNG